MSHEFEVHHLVSELISLLKIQDVSGSETYADVLLKNRTPYVTTQVSTHNAKRKIVEKSKQGTEFLKKYEELKLRHTRDLDPLVYLLSKLTEDRKLCEFLRKARPAKEPRASGKAGIDQVDVLSVVEGQEVALPQKGEIMTEEELSRLKGKLENVTATLSQKEHTKKQQQVKGKYPDLPSWLTNRPHLSHDYLPPPKPHHPLHPPLPHPSPPVDHLPLASLPLPLQQSAVIEDLLYLMLGVEGRYILTHPLSDPCGSRQFKVDHTLDVSLRMLVDRVLPICVSYSTVSRFIEENSKFVCGTVNQALAAAMRGLVREYFLVVTQLEHQFRLGLLTLQKMWYYVQSCMRTMDMLSTVALLVNKGSCRGGKTLSVLHSLTASRLGDQKTHELCLHLVEAACKPYFEMLSKWMYQGTVEDPYCEFMIEEHELIQKDRLHQEYNDAYWERRYTVCQENTPSFLESLADKILRTGKYLNVIKECGCEVDSSLPSSSVPLDFPPLELQPIGYAPHERLYMEQVERAHAYASKQLLQMMLDGQDLVGYLRSIKHYFLLDQGDLFVHFMDMSWDELNKPLSQILPSRMESLLELALRTSLADLDPYKDNVHALLVPYNLHTQLVYIMAIQPENIGPDALPPAPIRRPDPNATSLSGLEAFSLDYTVKWPLSLVISRKALFKYQMLFRHIFHCKLVERQLCATWTCQKVAKGLLLHSQPECASSFALLQQMLHFVQNLQYYMASEVLEPNWCVLELCLKQATCIDNVLTAHTDFLDKCLKDCMLTSREIIRLLTKLLNTCSSFSTHVQQLTQQAEVQALQQERSAADIVTTSLSDALQATFSAEEFRSSIARFKKTFTDSLGHLMEHLYLLSMEDLERTLGGLLARLDFNGFYKNTMHTTPVDEES